MVCMMRLTRLGASRKSGKQCAVHARIRTSCPCTQLSTRAAAHHPACISVQPFSAAHDASPHREKHGWNVLLTLYVCVLALNSLQKDMMLSPAWAVQCKAPFTNERVEWWLSAAAVKSACSCLGAHLSQSRSNRRRRLRLACIDDLHTRGDGQRTGLADSTETDGGRLL